MSSITSTPAGLSQFLQNITSNTTNPGANNSAGSITSTLAGPAAKAGRHTHHSGAFEKLANAVTNVLNSIGNTTTTDPNQTVKDALEKIFKNGSLDVTGDTEDSSSAPASNSATPPSTTSTAALPEAFAQTLQSFGITPQQFQTDLATALTAAQNSGSAEISSVFKNFPVGSVVDAVG